MKMGNHVPVIVIVLLISSVISATTSTSTETPTATVTTPTTGAAPSACAGGVGQLRKQYTIVSTRPYTALVWIRPSGGRYVVTCNPSCSPIAGYSATINATHTALTIDSLTQDDVGGWGLLDAAQAGAVPITVCRLSAVRLPLCSISSDEDTDSLEPGTQLTLTVDITGYYCSLEAGFNLSTGAFTDELMKTNSHVGVNQIMNDTFIVTLTRLGDVTLAFVCGTRWDLICGGVQKLIKTPPQCNITGDTDTNALVPGTKLTLTVDINSYYCPRETGFNLTTGHVTEELMASHKVSDVSDLSVNITFSVDVRRLGDVTLNFVCARTWNLKCNGVQELFKAPPQCNITGDTDTNALVPGTKLTLTVDINSYYCPRETGFNLTTGHVTEELMASHKVSDVSDLSVNKTFSVDVRRLGDVTLNFVCDRTWNLTCNGVQELVKTPPQCNITGDTDTNALVPGTKLTLTVDINSYYCPRETGFNLTTGHVTEELKASHKVSVVSDLSVNKTFSVDVRRLGDVTLNFVCDITWNLKCNGVQELVKTPPQCNIHGDTDTNALVPGTKLTLTVDINSYYCPRETGFNLTTGHVTEELKASHKVSVVSDLSVNKTFSVDVRRLGDVTLNFECDRTWNLKCNGVQELVKTPPQCNITGDTDTNALVPGTKLTLTVDINSYYCPRETGFNLTTGHVTEELKASHKVSVVSDLSVNKTFSVDVRRLGDVTLNFVCDRTWNLTCNGVQELFKTPPQCNITGDANTNALVPGTKLTLTVDINSYYCPRETGFNLTTGHVTEELRATHKVSDVSDLSVNKTFSVDVRRLGDVTLKFVCDRTWNVTCNGVQELFKTPPQCNITGDANTNALVPGTKLTLTVDINNYYCPRETGFNLTTGHVTEELRSTHKVSDVSDLSVNKTFSVDVIRLGDVVLTFVCDRTWNLTCNGVQELFKSPPQCNITGDTDTNALVPGTKLTLTVDINNYYCPRETGFNLTTGHVTEELKASHKVSVVSDLSVNKTFSVDVIRLGDVTLNFVCDRTWNVTCNGVQELFKSPPQCNITGDTDTNALVPGTKLTLTVDINNYYCPRETGFNLTTGHVTEELKASHNVSDVSDLSVNKTFSVDVRRLGDVTLNFVCDRTWNLTCNCVQELFKTPPQCNITGDTDTNALVPGTKLTLTVDINSYYCPRETGFNLTTGHVTEELMASHKVSDVSDLSVNKTFSVDVRRLGDVTLNFVCDRTWNLTCNGVQELFKSPPQCNITGDTDTNALVSGTKLTLTVDINNFYCLHNASFVLATGGVNDVLLQNQTTSNIINTAVTTSFVVGADHLGDVRVTYMCGNTSTSLTCTGVEKLTAVSSTRESITSTADFKTKEPSGSTAGPSTRAGSPTATAGPSTRAGSPATTAGPSTRTGSPNATELTQPMGGSSPTVTQETSASPTAISGTTTVSLNMTMIIIIVVLVIALLIVIIVVIVCCRRRYHAYRLSKLQPAT